MSNVPDRYQPERHQQDDLPGGEPIIVAASPSMLDVLSMARRAAESPSARVTAFAAGGQPSVNRRRSASIRAFACWH